MGDEEPLLSLKTGFHSESGAARGLSPAGGERAAGVQAKHPVGLRSEPGSCPRLRLGRPTWKTRPRRQRSPGDGHHHRLRRQGTSDLDREDHRILFLRLCHLLLCPPCGHPRLGFCPQGPAETETKAFQPTDPRRSLSHSACFHDMTLKRHDQRHFGISLTSPSPVKAKAKAETCPRGSGGQPNPKVQPRRLHRPRESPSESP